MSDVCHYEEMISPLPSTTVSCLPWDSSFFDFKVGRIQIREADSFLVSNALANARNDGYCLIYLSIESEAPQLRIKDFEGVGEAIDLKTTFIRNLVSPLQDKQVLDTKDHDGVHLKEKEAGPAGPDLEELAILSGSESRFFKDQNMPMGKAHQMYRIWINKCTEHELADSVIVAYSPSREIIGFITVKHEIDVSSIGLFAVDQQWQGRRIGSRLLQAAALSAIGRNNSKITVATQGSNVGACRAYVKNGYTVLSYQHLFHIWL
jgi:dTDP-4-amino-4,6-dideoxy-D-galactose acyltransferase